MRTQSVDAQAGDVFVDTEYDQMGRVKRATNPYRAGEAVYWTQSFYDDLSRVVKIRAQDNSEVNTNYDLAVSGAQIGTSVTVTDQAGKPRRSITNSLGQLTRVDEPNAGYQLGTISAPAQPTFYDYDTLGNLTRVNQGVQARTFAYDSLSRLKAAYNPESGTINYAYDANGNLTAKTDARNITTAYAYDALNRVQTRSYSDGITPNVSYFYDNLPNARGQMIKVSNGFSTTEYTQFDQMSRVTQSKQTTDGAAYNSSYAYNLAGALIEQTYPSGRIVKNVLDADGDLALVQSKRSGAANFSTYATNFSYTSAGAVSSMQLGNGRWESTQFNERLQPTQIALGTTPNAINLLKLNFEYGKLNWDGSTLAGTNNGNVSKQTVNTPNTGNTYGFVATQYYTYDALNRSEIASENLQPNDGSPLINGWRQNFSYDRYGNRRFIITGDSSTTTIPAGCADVVCNPQIDPNTNKLIGYTYDGAGNTIVDATGRSFSYDAENKQTEVRDGNNIVVGRYYYDGDGKRVKKVSATETTIFVYDAGGKLVAEYSNQTNSTPQISYLTSDHLGSPRIITDGSGNVTSRRDFMPFGEEARTWYRVPNLGYAVDDDVRQKFTGYERDDESELNYAKARYQNPNHGRFTSPDPAKMTKARTADPQHWNLYVYARNNPLVLVDITGEFPWRFLVRSFIYTSTVGPGGTFRGDGRAPSLETDPNIASSRTRLDFTLDYNRGRVTSYAVESDPTVFYGVAGVGRIERTAAPGVKFSSVETYFDKVKSVDFHYWAKDPVTPGFATPNLDVHANIAVSESITRFGSGTLNIAGTFTGDKFPSLEAFVVDQSGKTKVFLGAKYEEGGVGELYGDNKENLFKVDIQIKFDKKGNFTGVIQNGKHYTVDAWNERVQAQF